MPPSRRKQASRCPQPEGPTLFDYQEYASPEPRRAPAPPAPGGGDGGGEPLLFMSFGSGSSGNCAYLGTRARGVLIDAGVAPDSVMQALDSIGVRPEAVSAILVTHDHGDHVRYLYPFCRRHRHLAVCATPRCFSGIMRRHSVSRRLRDYHRAVYKEFEFEAGGLRVTPFDVSHDGTDNCGYLLQAPSGRTFAVATDLGAVTERVEHYLSLANYLMLEANYDPDMLRQGSYPEYLKARIAAPRGHLDNSEAGRLLARIWSPALSHVFLCHLSHDNNTPERATATVRAILAEAHPALSVGDGSLSLSTRDCPLQLIPLPRFDPSPLFVLP